jgi:uncharacterized protein (TIGR03663 family)
MKRWLPLLILIISILAAVLLRAPDLPMKPMHGDEAINAFKFDDLWTSGEYEYDPHEYHGPSLPYFTTVAMFLDGRGYSGSSEATFRGVNVAFGVMLVAIVWVIRHGLGSWETAVAAALTAVSPAMVFYSRYHIHEILLVFFTFAAIAAGWRYVRTRHAGAALACGASLAMMHATKETFVIAVAAMVWAILLVFVWGNVVVGKSWRITPPLRWKVIAAAVVVGAAVSAVFFSGFGTNWRGPIDSVLAYTTYLERGAGNSDHNKPWDYYLRLLGWNQYGRGPIWTELFILVLALIGMIEALRPRHRVKPAPVEDSPEPRTLNPEPSVWFRRFVAFYTISVIFIYSVIRYKTPWCVLSFLHGAILLAGVGAVALVRWMPHWLLKIPVALLLVAGTAHLGWQSYRLSFDPRLVAAPSPLNPYTYSQPRPGVLTAAKRIEQIAAVSPRKQDLRVLLAVPGNDYWPLPWYLRTFPALDFSDALDAAPSESDAPDVIITAAASAEEPPAWLAERYAFWDFFELRPSALMSIHVEKELWEAFIETRK